MKNKSFLSICILVLFLLYSLCTSAQKSKYRPFKLIVITTDTAIIDPSLATYVGKIEQTHLSNYYASIKQMEALIAFNNYPSDAHQKRLFIKEQKQTKIDIEVVKKNESEVKKFKYYQTISEFSTQVYSYFVNEYPPFSTFTTIPKTQLTNINMAHIADSLKANYVLGYKNIHTENQNGQIIMKLTTVVFSRSDNKIIIEAETAGNTNSYGDMWSCNDPLSCLMTNAVKSSTSLVFETLHKRQLK